MKKFSYYLRAVVNKIYFFSMVLIICFAVLVTLARFLTPVLARYKNDLTKTFANYLQLPLTINQITASWRDFHPVLNLHEVIISSPTTHNAVFHIQDLQIGFNLLQSLLQHKVVINHLYLRGSNIVLEQDANLHWSLRGLTLPNATNSSNLDIQQTVAWVLSQTELVIENLNLTINPHLGRPYTVSNINVILLNNDRNHQLRGQAHLAGHHSPLWLAIDLIGTADDLPRLTGNFYVQGSNTPLAPWLSDQPWLGFICQQGNFNFQLWGDWQNGMVNNLQSHFDFSNLVFTTKNKASSYAVDQLSANLLLQYKNTNEWQISGDQLQVMINNHNWPTDKFQISSSVTGNNNVQRQVVVNYLQLHDLNFLFSNLALIPEKIRLEAQHLALAGEVKNLQAQFSQADKETDFHLTADLNALGNQAYKNIPGVTGLTGTINTTHNAGHIELHSDAAIVNYPQLFRQALPLTALQVSADWWRDQAGIHIQAPQLQLQDANFITQSDLDLLIAPVPTASRISLLTQFTLRDLSQAKLYFPAKIMDHNLVAWLDQAFVAGQQVKGNLLLFGRLHDFPYLKNDGQFIVDSNLQQLQFNFLPQWPQISNLSGRLIFHKNSMQFVASAGTIAQQPITQLSAVIPNMNQHPYAKLSVDSDIDFQQLSAGRDFILQSPLKDSVGKSLAPLHFNGTGQLHLKLQIPLGDAATLTTGDLAIHDTKLLIPAWQLDFEHVNGNLHFTDDSFSAKNLQAKFLNEPIKIQIATINQAGQRHTQFSTIVLLHLTDLKNYFSWSKLNFITGDTLMNSLLDIDSKDNMHLILTSQLTGINIDMPVPFLKTKNQSHPFRVDAYFQGDEPPQVRITYQGLLGALLGFIIDNDHTVLQRVMVHLGSGSYQLQSQAGIYLTGNLDQFKWSDWQTFYQKYFSTPTVTSATTNQSSLNLQQVNVHINLLQAVRQVLTDVQLRITRQLSSWLVNIDSNQVSGAMTVPMDYQQHAITGEFAKLHLVAFTDDKSPNLTAFDPAKVIPFNISANDFAYENKNFGQVHLQLHPIIYGMQIDQLDINNRSYHLATHGQWLRRDSKDSSAFSGNLATDDMGALFLQQGFTNHLKGGKGGADFDLTWPDAPTEFQNKNLQGTIKLNFKNGAIVGLDSKTNQKIGLGKLINILSIQSIWRTLTLNFSDLNQTGFNYTTLSGDLMVKNNNVYTQNLYLNGSVAELFLTGDVGIHAQTYDVNLKVNPYVTSSLPVIATIAGGPIAGVATWAVSELARGGIKKIVVYQYHIGGTWDDPIIKDLSKK